MHIFDQEIERKGTNCIKWDSAMIKDNVTPMWVADMDIPVAPAITKRLMEAAQLQSFGYMFLSEHYYNAIVKWFRQQHEYVLKPEWITYIPNVAVGLLLAVQAISEPGDEIIIHTPVYAAFRRVIEDTGRVLVESPLKQEKGYYTIDFEDFENRITKNTKGILFCNPHNPSGRVWQKEELQQLSDLCRKHNLYIISDDIHCELTLKGHPYTMISTLSAEVEQRTILLTSPSKAFNLASIHVANAFIANDTLRSRFRSLSESFFCAGVSAFVEPALLGAYEDSKGWLEQLTDYLEDNITYFVNYVQDYIPKLRVYKPEGTYLVWVDCRNLQIDTDTFQEFFSHRCQVEGSEGTIFGKEGQGYIRFNLACPRKVIEEVLERIREQVNGSD